MASAASPDDELITGINVTPLVDVVLVLLVILMVTASYVVSRSVPLELPKAATADAVPSTLVVSVGKEGELYLDGAAIDPAGLRARVRLAHGADPDTRAVIAADGRARHAQVVKVIDLLRQENVTKFAINVEPEDLAGPDGVARK
jgi:biopolymer transport protein ExbD